MRAFERRWVHDILSSFAPQGGPELAPRAGEVEYFPTFAGLHQSARGIARVGFRAALWLVALAPIWLLRRGCTFGKLALEERQALLGRLLDHPVYAVREAAFLLKFCACLALFASDDLRARSGYDGRQVALLTKKPEQRR
jgi:hypothetical protein